MKNAKKVITIGLASCMALAATACGGGAKSKDETYKVSYDNSLGSEVLDSIPEYQFLATDLSYMVGYGMNLDITLDLTADGTYKLTSKYSSQGEAKEGDPSYADIHIEATGTYTKEESKVTISAAESATAVYQGGSYITEQGMFVPFSYAADGTPGEWTSEEAPEILDCVPETVFTVTEDGKIETWEPAGEKKGNPKAEASDDTTSDGAAADSAATGSEAADFTMLSPEWDAVNMAFHADGTCEFNLAEYGITEECTWAFENGVLTVTKSDGTTAVSEMDGDTMKLVYDSVSAPGQMVGNFESTDWADFFK